MYSEISKLIVYKDISNDSLISGLSEIFRKFEGKNFNSEQLVSDIYSQIHRLLEISTEYGFDDNLWQSYLAFMIATTETPFSMVCELSGASEGSVNSLATHDFKLFKKLFNYDFSDIEYALSIDCFSTICSYKAVKKDSRKYNESVSVKVRNLRDAIRDASDEDEIFLAVTEFYRQYGVGALGLNKAFRLKEVSSELEPISNTQEVYLDDLIGYEIQKKTLVENTEAFVSGRKANNVLLFGDSGTGKSTSIKAILNEYYDQGLRVIEIYKHQFKYLSNIIASVKNRNYRFIIYMDDLSFEDFEIEYKYLKAVIEGGLEITPENILIYATSNRRHLIKENWSDREDVVTQGGLHQSDSMEEKLSLVNRFGITINYSKPSRSEYLEIVRKLAEKHPEIAMSEDELAAEANKWELWHGGISGRTAQQFINYLLGKTSE